MFLSWKDTARHCQRSLDQRQQSSFRGETLAFSEPLFPDRASLIALARGFNIWTPSNRGKTNQNSKNFHYQVVEVEPANSSHFDIPTRPQHRGSGNCQAHSSQNDKNPVD